MIEPLFDKAARELGFKSTQSFEQEVTEITQWYKDQGWL